MNIEHSEQDLKMCVPRIGLKWHGMPVFMCLIFYNFLSIIWAVQILVQN
jgi:hypothetical protein